MALGAFLEPLVVIGLLFGATWINRVPEYELFLRRQSPELEYKQFQDAECGCKSTLNSPRQAAEDLAWRKRDIRLLGFEVQATSPNTAVFKDRFLSRLLRKFPFLVQAWYWALIYWVYQLGRAFTAVTLVEGTVHVARVHALQLIELEKSLFIFWELDIQAFLVGYPYLMTWINRIYSFIHIPGTIIFLVWLYYWTTTKNRLDERQEVKEASHKVSGSPAGPGLFDSRWRTLAACNLIAFVVFTAWPCMPPRLLSDKSVSGPTGAVARSYGFVDTVHGEHGEASVWTQNKFCNQYAAMPSLHFGYSLLIGLTIALIPMPAGQRRGRSFMLPFNTRLRLPSRQRLLYVGVGIAYPTTILIAIIATANHFILDAVAGAIVCGIAWRSNELMLNLLPIEDYFLWCVRIHKPGRHVVEVTVDGVVAKGVLDG